MFPESSSDFEIPCFACGRVTFFACTKKVTKEMHPGRVGPGKAPGLPSKSAPCFKAAWMRHPGLSMLKCTSMCISPWQDALFEATLMGRKKAKPCCNRIVFRVAACHFLSRYFQCHKNKYLRLMHRDVRMPQAQRPPWMAEGRTTQEQLSRCARAAFCFF